MRSKYLKCDDIEPGDLVFIDKKTYGEKAEVATVVDVLQIFARIRQDGVEDRDIVRSRLTKKESTNDK